MVYTKQIVLLFKLNCSLNKWKMSDAQWTDAFENVSIMNEKKECNSVKFPRGKLFILVTAVAIVLGVTLGIALR